MLLSVQQSPAHIQRIRDECRAPPGRSPAGDVRHGAVGAVWVQVFLRPLVDDEVDGLVRHVHQELGWEAAIEGADALRAVSLHEAAATGRVRRSVHLHALLDHCEHKRGILLERLRPGERFRSLGRNSLKTFESLFRFQIFFNDCEKGIMDQIDLIFFFFRSLKNFDQRPKNYIRKKIQDLRHKARKT